MSELIKYFMERIAQDMYIADEVDDVIADLKERCRIKPTLLDYNREVAYWQEQANYPGALAYNHACLSRDKWQQRAEEAERRLKVQAHNYMLDERKFQKREHDLKIATDALKEAERDCQIYKDRVTEADNRFYAQYKAGKSAEGRLKVTTDALKEARKKAKDQNYASSMGIIEVIDKALADIEGEKKSSGCKDINWDWINITSIDPNSSLSILAKAILWLRDQINVV